MTEIGERCVCGAYYYCKRIPGQATIVTIRHRTGCPVQADEDEQDAYDEAEHDAEMAYDAVMRGHGF